MSLASSMGMGQGLIALTFMTRVAYLPLGIYSQLNMHKMKQIKPESDEINSKIKMYFQSGEREKA